MKNATTRRSPNPDSRPPQPAARVAPAVVVTGGYPCTRTGLVDWLRHEFPGCRPIAVGSAEAIRQAVASEQPAVVLVDIDLPGMHGLELLRFVRPLAGAAALVALSAYHAESYRDYAIGAGAAACVSPQVADGSLKQMVGSLLAAPQRSAA